jgi:uncharacterized integral membrane protein
MNKKLATAIVAVMLAALAGLVIAATVTYKSLGTIKAEYTETR